MLLAAVLTAGCAFGGEDPCEGVTCSGLGSCMIEGATATCDCNEGYQAQGLECVKAAGHAQTLSTALESSSTHSTFLNFRTNKAGQTAAEVGADANDYDLKMSEPTTETMSLSLGPSATAINLGATKTFHEVAEAPADGYQPEADQPVGTSFHSSGSCPVGYVMTKNIYVLKLVDGSYAKFEVLNAKQGISDIQYFRQPDLSRNLFTEP
jgi:hypothetical protein